ncbi:MAG: MBL fold metallo-hydrolase [Anaerolineales bacterium]|nr:MBL fold metallo-hydrolase [Anaerolineales bacterium]
MLSIVSLTLGPVLTNTYIIADGDTGEAVVIDPADEGERIFSEAEKRGWRIVSIWLTHAHFDHMGGAAELADTSKPVPTVALHAEDMPLWRIQGGAAFFGMKIEPGPEPTIELTNGQDLYLGENKFQVLHAPGHTPGHVMFYNAAEAVLFCGDVIFQGSIGRTDLPGGDFNTLINSILSQVMSLPDETVILCGHGPQSTVGQERKLNPFIQ